MSGIEVFSPVSHTLFDPAEIIEKVLYSWKHLCSFIDRMFGVTCLRNVFISNLKNGGRPPLTYQSFVNIAGEPAEPVVEEYSVLPPVGDTGEYELFYVPKLQELGYGDISQVRAEPH